MLIKLKEMERRVSCKYIFRGYILEEFALFDFSFAKPHIDSRNSSF